MLLPWHGPFSCYAPGRAKSMLAGISVQGALLEPDKETGLTGPASLCFRAVVQTTTLVMPLSKLDSIVRVAGA